MEKFSREDFRRDFKKNVLSLYGKRFEDSSEAEKYGALSKTIMDLIQEDWVKTSEKNEKKRNAYYMSAEFLIGRSLGNNLLNLGIFDEVKDLLKDMDLDFDLIEDQEEDAALGNGGLGRLAACFVESAASMDLPLQGYGVRYSEGIFKQKFEDGFQKELGDNWTLNGDFWSIRKDSEKQIVTFRDYQVEAIPYDVPIVGYENQVVNTLRLWQAEAIDGGFDFDDFNNFQYDKAVGDKNRAEDITRVLYPNDIQRDGKLLRLTQQYFFVSASILDLIKKYKRNFPEDDRFENFSSYHVLQLNDTHPVIALPELMRILLDDEKLSWDEAFKIASESFAFTNHTVLQEALEKWSLDLIDEVAPRCKDIIVEIDRRLMEDLDKAGIDKKDLHKYRIVHDGMVEMAFLATYMAKSINGVAEIHTEILKADTLNPWYKLYPEKFNNKTNGVTPRRWLQYSNPELTLLVNELLGSEDWQKDLSRLKELEKFQDDPEVLDRLNEIKFTKKKQLADYIEKTEGIKINPNSIYDIQIKRLHEYKRQLLNALHIVDLYNRIKENPNIDMVPRTFIFGAKAAPGYFRAKGIIKFINEIADLVNNDPEVNDKLQVVFVQNYRVSYAEKLFPAADLSEQISTAGKEASGTGNMKFMMNATPTIGTLDGANVEIFREAGLENNYLFGAKVEELEEIKDSYDPKWYYHNYQDIKDAVNILIDESKISDGGRYYFLDIYNELVNPQDGSRGDNYYLLKDFHSYKTAHQKVDEDYRDRRKWAKKCLLNLANSGIFSSDRTIGEYAEEIWKL